MQRIKFAYNEPRIGDIEIDSPPENIKDYIGEEEIISIIESQFPEAIDIEILETEIV